MNIPRNFRTLKKLVAAAGLAGGLGLAVIGLGAGVTNAGPRCDPEHPVPSCPSSPSGGPIDTVPRLSPPASNTPAPGGCDPQSGGRCPGYPK
jgi:hypothetical protein